MPQRFLKPGIRTSRRLAACSSDSVRWFYALILTLVDDFGRYEADPVRLKNEAYPLREDLRTEQVRAWLNEFSCHQLALFYKVDGKAYFALTQWEERARYASRYPRPPDSGKAQALGCKLETDNYSCLQDNLSPQQTPKPVANSQKPEPKPSEGARARPKLTEVVAPEVLEPKRKERPNSPELAFAQAEFVRVNEQCKAEPGYTPYTAEEVRQAWQWFESGKDAETGEWLLMFGSQRKPVGDWKAALMERIGHNRNIYAKRNTNSIGPTRGEDTRDHAAGF